MNDDIRVPLGVCDVTFQEQTYFQLADAAVFEAIPTYDNVRAGQFQKLYMVTDYVVSLDLMLNDENYNTLKLSYPALQDYKNGLYDNPAKVNYHGEPLVIHPVEAGESKEYDITIFSAILDPEKGYTRTYSKGLDMVSIRFLGQPAKRFEGNAFKSYFFIGDTDEAGVKIWIF